MILAPVNNHRLVDLQGSASFPARLPWTLTYPVPRTRLSAYLGGNNSAGRAVPQQTAKLSTPISPEAYYTSDDQIFLAGDIVLTDWIVVNMCSATDIPGKTTSHSEAYPATTSATHPTHLDSFLYIYASFIVHRICICICACACACSRTSLHQRAAWKPDVLPLSWPMSLHKVTPNPPLLRTRCALSPDTRSPRLLQRLDRRPGSGCRPKWNYAVGQHVSKVLFPHALVITHA